MLLDPRDYSWEECLRDYRRRRALALAELRSMHKSLRQYRQAINELAEESAFVAARQNEFMDRLTICALTEVQEQQTLANLRHWFKLCKVVHERMTRADYQLERIASHLEIDSADLKKGLAQFMSRFATKH